MTKSLKQQTISATAWQMSNGLLCNAIQIIVTIILARYIMPEQYGMIAILAIFIAIAQTLIYSNLGTALIRKSNRTETDCSTVFYYNLSLSILLYIALCLIAPFIAQFYNITELTQILRILSISLIIGALGNVQKDLYIAELNFKIIAIINFLSIFISGTIGIILAILDFKIWALVAQLLANTSCNTILIWCVSKWRPKFIFSFKSLNELFSFSSKLMISKLLDTIFKQLYSAVIGKLFAPAILGLYNRAETFVGLTSQMPSDTISTVSYPALCKLSGDDAKLKSNYRRILRLSAFIIFPLCLGVGAIAKPLVNVLLTDNWIEMVPILQILVFALMWYPVHALNLNLLQVKGRSDLFLKLELIKKIIIIITLVVTIPFGIITICIGRIITSLISLFINTYYTSKLLQLSLSKQLMDILPILLLSITMYIISFGAINFFDSSILNLGIGIIVGITIYLGGAILFKLPEIHELHRIIKQSLTK